MVVDVTCSEDECDTKIFNGKYSAIGETINMVNYVGCI